MKLKIFFVFQFIFWVNATEVLDLGNLDIKGQISLPKYTRTSIELDLVSSLKKIATLEFNDNMEVDRNIGVNNKNLNAGLVEDKDFVFDLKVKKMELE